MPLTEINYTSIDKNNFEEIYLYYFPRLLRFAREYVISQEDAENIIQDVFLLLWEKRDDLQIHISLTSFLFTLIKNRCIDHLRRKTNVEQGKKQLQENYFLELKMKLYSLEALNQSIISDENIEKIITNAIDSLPPKCREIFLLNKMEGKKYREIAEDLNISVNTVENQMSIALRKLREKLKNYLPVFISLYYF
jgi:RNA polymerase sigma-70 factor (ECF subfamily)